MMKKLSIAIFAFCLSVCCSDIALSSQKPSEEKIFWGVIRKLDDGTALFTKEVIYPLIGGDFQSIVGKEVFVIGRIKKENNVEKIMVHRIQFDKK